MRGKRFFSHKVLLIALILILALTLILISRPAAAGRGPAIGASAEAIIGHP